MNFDTAKDYSREDGELLSRFIETGDAVWFGELYTRYMPLVYGLCLKYLGNVEDAEDAVMQIFEELTPKLENYRIKNFRTWLWSVAKNHCLQILRREKRGGRPIKVDFDERFMESPRLLHLLSEGKGVGEIAEVGGVGGVGVEREDEAVLAALERCMDKLSERQKEAVAMFFMEKRSYAEIADATLHDVKGVKSYIQNGKRNLKMCLEKHGVSL